VEPRKEMESGKWRIGASLGWDVSVAEVVVCRYVDGWIWAELAWIGKGIVWGERGRGGIAWDSMGDGKREVAYWCVVGLGRIGGGGGGA